MKRSQEVCTIDKQRGIMHVARLLCALLFVSAFGPGPAAAQLLAPTPAPLEYCPFHVALVAGLDHDPKHSQMYAVAVESEFALGKATGTLAFYAGDDRYEVSFENAGASVRGDSLNAAMPIVVQFPEDVHIDAAYVSSLAVPVEGYCAPGNVWFADAKAHTPPIVPFDRALFRKAAAASTPVEATLEHEEAPPGCDHPNVPVHPAPAETSASSLLAHALQAKAVPPRVTVAVAVALAPSGNIVGTKVIVSKAGRATEERALRAALDTVYRPEIFRCKRVYSTYIFTQP